MSITSYKRLTTLLAVGIILLLGIVWHLNFKLHMALLDAKENEQSTWVTVRDIDKVRDWALQADTQKAVDYLDMLDQYPPREWTARIGNLARVIEIERASAIREVIAYLRKKTGEDLGDDPQKWVEKYGAQSRRPNTALAPTAPSAVAEKLWRDRSAVARKLWLDK
jgi:hypothetical protein